MKKGRVFPFEMAKLQVERSGIWNGTDGIERALLEGDAFKIGDFVANEGSGSE